MTMTMKMDDATFDAASMQPVLAGETPQRLPEERAAPGQARHHGPDRAAEDLGHLLIAQALEVDQHGALGADDLDLAARRPVDHVEVDRADRS